MWIQEGPQHSALLTFYAGKTKKALDKGLTTSIFLTGLTKAFDCISHDLLIAMLNAYGLSTKSLGLIYDYISHRKQRTKVNESYSSWHDIFYGVPQGSVLGPLLFNIYINDLFFSDEFQMMNFADDCSPYNFTLSINDVIHTLEKQTALLIELYKCNYLKSNPDKWHLILSEREPTLFANVGNKRIFNSNNEEVLGGYFNNKLNFEYHIGKLCKKSKSKTSCPCKGVIFYEL